MNKAGAIVFIRAGVLGLAFLLPGVAAAAWPIDPLVNVPVCAAVGDQQTAVSVADGAGGAIVVWADFRSGDGDIYAQRVSVGGAPQWALDGVAVCTFASTQYYPIIVADGAGGAIVTWQDYRNGNLDLFAQRISAEGILQWAADGLVVCADVDDQYEVVSTADGAGGVIIAWWDSRNVNSDIFVQKISGAGAVQWTANGLALSSGAGEQRTPAIVGDGAGGAIVAWQDWPGSFYADIKAQRVSAAGSAQWVANGVVVCAASNTQALPVAVADGAGGAVIAWADQRASAYHDMYAQRISSGGAPQWTADGVALCTMDGSQYYPSITTDGAGGAIVAWQDDRSGWNLGIYAQRISGAGVAQWTTDGTALVSGYSAQSHPAIAPDGAGGAIVTWNDARGSGDVYAQKISSVGAAKWPTNGGAVCTASGGQYNACIVTNGAGDAVIVWNDGRNGNQDIYAQRVDRLGIMFNVAKITSVRDIAGDQGGKVRVAWSRGFLDAAPDYEISLYGIWRQVSTTAAKAAIAAGALLADESGTAVLPQPDVFRTTADGGKTRYWEGVGTVAARGEPTYTFVAPTLQDSTGAGSGWTVFMVDAHLAYQPGFFDSAPDSGYSVDNLAPASPAPFTGRYLGASTALHWGRTFAYDLAGYQLYRGDAANFLPGPATFVVAKPDTGFVDQVTGNHFYQLYAVDIHGNLSACAQLSPQQTSPVPAITPATLRLHPNAPNPFNPLTKVRFDLPAGGAVRLTVFDVAGRLIRTLVDASMSPGSHEAVWDGRDSSGRDVGSGTYLARLEFGGKVETVRMALVQ